MAKGSALLHEPASVASAIAMAVASSLAARVMDRVARPESEVTHFVLVDGEQVGEPGHFGRLEVEVLDSPARALAHAEPPRTPALAAVSEVGPVGVERHRYAVGRKGRQLVDPLDRPVAARVGGVPDLVK